MKRTLWPRALSRLMAVPITVRAPLLVACLMLVVSAAVTERVLSRLQSTQEAHVAQLASTYMDGLTAAVMPHVLRHDVWEVFDALDRSRASYKALELISTTVTAVDDFVIASSEPLKLPADTRLSDTYLRQFGENRDFIVDYDAGSAHTRRLLTDKDRRIGAIYAEIGIAQLLAERRDVLTTLALTNALLTAVLVTLGYFAVRGMVKPIKILTDHLGQGRSGAIEPIPDQLMPRANGSFGRLFTHYNEMARAVNERETLAIRLAHEEKLASLGRLASGMAHEINNPLGGLFNVIDSLKRHGDKEGVRSKSIDLLERGLSGIRDVVRASLLVYRSERSQRDLDPTDFEDLRVLLRPELRRRQLSLAWTSTLDQPVPLPAAAVRDAVLNLLLNACAASPQGGTVSFDVGLNGMALEVAIRDNGPGMPTCTQAYLEGQGAGKAPVEDRSGLGLWMVRRLASELGGEIRVMPAEARGTIVTLRLPVRTATELRDVA
jgi:signal transduction histidine kinase